MRKYVILLVKYVISQLNLTSKELGDSILFLQERLAIIEQNTPKALSARERAIAAFNNPSEQVVMAANLMKTGLYLTEQQLEDPAGKFLK